MINAIIYSKITKISISLTLVILLIHTLLAGGRYDSVRCIWSFYLIVPFLKEGYDSVTWGMIKFKMAMLEYDLINFCYYMGLFSFIGVFLKNRKLWVFRFVYIFKIKTVLKFLLH